MSTFYKTTIQIEILSQDEPIGSGLSLSEIEYHITDGHCSGNIRVVEQKEISASEAGRELINQGSDPEFFGLRGPIEGLGGMEIDDYEGISDEE